MTRLDKALCLISAACLVGIVAIRRFRFACSYACTQSGAIPGLSQISAEDAYLIHCALHRGKEHHQRQVGDLLKELAELTKDLDHDELRDLLDATRSTQQP